MTLLYAFLVVSVLLIAGGVFNVMKVLRTIRATDDRHELVELSPGLSGDGTAVPDPRDHRVKPRTVWRPAKAFWLRARGPHKRAD